MIVVLEDDVGELELAGALDVDLARAVDHDFRDRLVAEERLERAETDDLVRDLLEHADALGTGQREAFLVDDLAEDLLDLTANLDLVRQVELRIEVLDDAVLDPELDVTERLAGRRRAHEPRATGGRPSCGRGPRGGWHVGIAAPGRGRRPGPAGTRSSALDPLQETHRLYPFSPRGHATVNAMRTATSSVAPSPRHRPTRPAPVRRSRPLPVGGCPATPVRPCCSGRTVRPGSRRRQRSARRS